MGQGDHPWNAGSAWEPVPGREGIEVKARVEVPKEREAPQPCPEPEEQEYDRRQPKIKKED
eukprot:10093597-Alexandrium_andersonii.AAC.1